MAKILTVTSGKGGVGKTNISVNLAIHLSRLGYRTCLFDADLGLANINILLGIYPEYNLKDVIDGVKTLKDIIIHDKNGIDIIPGSSGVAEMETLSSVQLGGLASSFAELKDYDYLIFDTSAGVSKSVIAFCMNASEVILIITPEPTSLTDAYALIKILSMNGYKKVTKVVVNQSKNSKTAQIAYKKLKDTTRKFLGVELSPLGTIASDPRVIEAVSAQQPFITLFPKTQASRCINTIAKYLQEKDTGTDDALILDNFWQRCVDIFSSPIKMPVRKEKTVSVSQPSAYEPQPSAQQNGASVSEIPKEKAPSETHITKQKSIQHGDQNQQFLEKLLEKISSVSEELSGIRKLLEKGALNASLSDPINKNADGTTPTPSLINLDFEAFLEKQKAKGTNSAV